MVRNLFVCGTLAAALVCSFAGSVSAQSLFVRGDLTGDAALQLEDPLALLGHLFQSTGPLICFDAGDFNDSGDLGLDDAIGLLGFMFSGGPPPSAPFPDCGADPTDDALDCVGPLSDCPLAGEPPMVDFLFADDTIQETVGIYIGRNDNPVDASNFDEYRFLMRPFEVSVDPGFSGTIQIDQSGSNLELFTEAGDPLPMPAEFTDAELPVTLLLNAPGTGDEQLIASSFGMDTIVRVRAGRFPGLAGSELGDFPHFQFENAFNFNGPDIQTALDGGRHAERAGLPYDVYVVEHKSPAEWAASNALTDVTAAVETSAVSDVSIQDNILTVWTGGAFDGGDAFGKGYDVVFDFGQDGTLDPGDLIDGLDPDTAGLYVLKNVNQGGPLDVTTINYSGGGFLGQRTYFPTNIDTMGQLPLVVISHGNGHQHTWYDYLGNHLASYGYIVMSHQNNTGPGSDTASLTTISNTNYILANQDSISGGVLDGHIDGDRITWIGHSRGGEGVVRAYDRLFDGTDNPAQYDTEDIILVSSIAPTVFLGTNNTHPHEVTYHLIAGAADGDVTGGADCNICQFFRITSKGTGNIITTYVQGASHNDFNCCGFADGTGPNLIGPNQAKQVARTYYIALVELYVKGNEAARDFFTRMYDDYHPTFINSNVVVANAYEDAMSVGNDIIDNYQGGTDPSDVSSSGGLVTWDVANLNENELDDNNITFSWTGGDPQNGMTQSSTIGGDFEKGVSFQWPDDGSERFYELEVIPDFRDFGDDAFLSFRACQGTRHPNTNSLAGTMDFTVTLRDSVGVTSSINFGVYGRLTRPYQRTGLGAGAGWANEFKTVRIRLADFENDYSGINLHDIVAVRFEFGGSKGSLLGRAGIDDVMVTKD